MYIHDNEKKGADVAKELFDNIMLPIGDRIVRKGDMTHEDMAEFDRIYWERERQIAMDEDRAARAKREKALGSWRLSFSAFRTQESSLLEKVKKTCEKFCKADDMRALVLSGPNGVGKTHLLKSIALESGAHYASIIDICDRFVEAKNFSNRDNEHTALREWYMTPIICIDEIGRYSRPDVEKDVLFRIIDHRTEMQFPYALATNMTKEQLRQFAGEAIRSRLNQYATPLDMSGIADYRQRKTK